MNHVSRGAVYPGKLLPRPWPDPFILLLPHKLRLRQRRVREMGKPVSQLQKDLSPRAISSRELLRRFRICYVCGATA